MSTETPARLEPRATDDDSTDPLDDRTRRALEQHLTVTPDVGPARGADGLAIVTSESGREYLVDVEAGTCGRKDGAICPDQEYNLPDGEPCKHVIRARIAMGHRPVSTAELAAADVVPDLGAHAAGPRVVTSDGGIVEAGDGAEILDADSEDQADIVDLAEVTGDGPLYTYHTEPTEQGGARYVRCEACGAECIPADPDRMLHAEGCPEGER